MSSLKDFNKILNDFENEVNNLKDIAGAYNKILRLIQLQIELSSKLDDNMQSLNNIVEKQKDLDLAKQLESLDILSEHINVLTSKVGQDMEVRFSETLNAINTMNKNLKDIEKHSTQHYQNIETLIIKQRESVLGSLKENNKELMSKLENIGNTTLDKIKNNKEIIDRSYTNLSSELNETIKIINKNQNESQSSLLDKLDSIKYDINTEIKVVEQNLIKKQKALSDENKLIKIILMITFLASISASVINFIK